MAKAIRTVLSAGVYKPFAERLEPLLQTNNFDVDYVSNADAAVDLLRAVGFDVLLLGYPTVGISVADLLAVVRSPDGPCRRSAVILIAPSSRIGELEPFLQNGSTRALAQDASDHELRREVLALLRVAPRRAVRVTVRLQVLLADGRTELMSQTENVSASGVLVRTTKPYPVETPVRFDIYLPEAITPISGSGTVARLATDAARKVTGIGVKFLSFANGGDVRLRDFLARR